MHLALFYAVLHLFSLKTDSQQLCVRDEAKSGGRQRQRLFYLTESEVAVTSELETFATSTSSGGHRQK